ncbi:MAG: methionyl aminopeptidase [Chlamydiota bacterium]
MQERNDPCFCGSGKKWKKCHFPMKKEESFSHKYFKQYGILLKNSEQILGIQKASHTAAVILDHLCKKALAGVTTNELDAYAVELHKQMKAIAAPLGYGSPPFPKSICTSLNEVICHGIPNDKPLQEGDFLNIDVTSIVDGYYGDCSRMVLIGKVDPEKEKVSRVSYECLMKSIDICKPGVCIYEIGEVIEDYASSQGCSVVNQFVGHGVGVHFHEPPQIPHHYNTIQIPLVPGMTFTIEPMINAGSREAIIDSMNLWEARTRDMRPSAQWEHTLLITDSGCEILTKVP